MQQEYDWSQMLSLSMAEKKQEQIKQLNPLLPGYDFDIFLVAGMTPIEHLGGLDYRIDRPLGLKGYIINLTIDGEGEIFHGDQSFIVKRGDLLLFPPKAIHDYGRAPHAKTWFHRWVYFRPRAYWVDWLRWPDAANQVGRISLHDSQQIDELDNLFLGIEETHKEIRPMSEPLAMNMLERLLIRCYEECSIANSQPMDHRILEACQILSSSLAEDISIDQLAEQVFLSPSRLAHLFREQMGASVVRWREDQRVVRAKQLLQTTLLPVAVIAQQTGYDDQLYFSRVFKKRVGVSPSEYRKSTMFS